MMKFIQTILIFLISSGIAVFMLFASFGFGIADTQGSDDTVKNMTGGALTFYKSMLSVGTGSLQSSLTYTLRSDDPSELKKNEVFYIDFGRLSSIFFLPDTSSGSADLQNFRTDGNTLILPASGSMIVSLYDPFSSYSLRPKTDVFRIDQITNGSFYIGNELDGTISLYSIDAVGTLTFLSQGKEMTSMTLFPGMYFRFNPSENKNLSGSDLFQIIQSVSVQNMGKITGIEFVNPRIDTGNSLDAFFMYRLPPQTRVLFRQLRTLFVERVNQVNMMRAYTASGEFLSLEDMNSLLINPGKRNAILLMDLQSTFSDSLQAGVDTEKFVKRIRSIHDTAKTLPIGNDVEKLFQNFLTDGRFALFSQTTDQKFLGIYNEVAKIIGIAPVTQKYQLFQKLSDIYSRNLVNQLQGVISKVDVYTPSATELVSTLSSSGMTGDDSFNIALYAFSIVSKYQEQGLFTLDALKNIATYNFIYTIFVATDHYISSITDFTKKDSIQDVIVHQLYIPLSNSLVASLYKHFTLEREGYIYLNDTFFPDGPNEKMKFDSNFVASVNKISGVIKKAASLVTLSGSSSSDYARLNIDSLRIQAFVKLFNTTQYGEYIKNPLKSTSDNGINLPQLSDNGIDLFYKNDTKKVITGSGNTNVPTSSENPLLKIQKIFGNIPQNQITREDDGFRINRVSMRIDSTPSDVPIFFVLSCKLNLDITILSEIQIEYQDRNIVFSRDQYLPTDFISFLSSQASFYFQKIALSLKENPGLNGDITIFVGDNRITIGGYNFNL